MSFDNGGGLQSVRADMTGPDENGWYEFRITDNGGGGYRIAGAHEHIQRFVDEAQQIVWNCRPKDDQSAGRKPAKSGWW